MYNIVQVRDMSSLRSLRIVSQVVLVTHDRMKVNIDEYLLFMTRADDTLKYYVFLPRGTKIVERFDSIVEVCQRS